MYTYLGVAQLSCSVEHTCGGGGGGLRMFNDTTEGLIKKKWSLRFISHIS